MKKFELFISALLLAVFVFCACSNSDVTSKAQPNENATTIQNNTDKAAEPAQTPVTTQKPDESNFIGKDRAKEITLKKAGLTADDVFFDRIELDFDNGVWEYEVEFKQGRTEYSADIKADDGTIISWEKDIDD